MDLSEPKIYSEDILVVSDKNFVTDNVCIVTGSGSGIGRAASVAIAVNGLTTVGLDIDEKAGEETRDIVTELGGQMVFIKTDLTKDEDIVRAVNASAELGQIKYLANIAGIQHIDSIENFPMEKYDLMQRIMLRAPLYLSKLCIPHMKESSGGSGAIGNMTSVHGHICTINKPAYNITKFGLRALTQSIAAEGEGRIRAFSVSTGFVKTALALDQIPAQAEQRRISQEAVVTDVMMGRSRIKEMMSPIEVGNLFAFGFSRFAKYLAGGDLLFDGGMVLTY
ncbi:MAG: SDR family oxidoreductase [Proteobacteria bacterium]|nr:SDR family oxidoreductase [Pseudomonadota bacterium]